MKRMTKRNLWTAAAIGIATGVPLMLSAASLKIEELWTFSPNTVISSSKVNENFVMLDDRIATYEDAITVDGNKNVGLGTLSPATKLHVTGTALFGSGAENAYSPYIRASNGLSVATTPDYSFWYDDQTGIFHPELSNLALTTGGNEVLRIDENHNVGIGTTSPTQRLHVVGNVTADDYLYNSDLRLKADVEPLKNAVEGIACLQGVTYRWSEPSAPQDLQVGLIAQDVERCFPEVVTTDPHGYKSVSYARLVAPLIENAKEQQQVLAAQQQALTAQQRELARLKAEQAATNARLQTELGATNARFARLEALLTARR